MLLSCEIIAISESEPWSGSATPTSRLSDGGSAAMTEASPRARCEDGVQ